MTKDWLRPYYHSLRSLPRRLRSAVYFGADWWRIAHQKEGKIVVINGGAHKGELIPWTLTENFTSKIYELERIPFFQMRDLAGAEFHFFEPNPTPYEALYSMKQTFTGEIFIYQKAVWIEKCSKEFFLSVDDWGDFGSTLHKEKREKLLRSASLTVECIRLSQFIMDTFSRSDYIILVLDVEGSEYEIVHDLLTSGAIRYVNELYIEWHDWLFPEKRKIGYKLRQRLRFRLSPYYHPWYF